ncbi:bifunctional 3-deoxy-7-phosphoheptulonate synthase/chorismate mutase [Paenibacillus thailandensis]|uniref:Bifunctional 3-deoxy-7-phosphoheptulonate synthase/chorismate mutase n=1 Tax=Paenibacillus thailandensis TaxID=393250 RepID=A0ABW5R6I6_9BACL
MNTATAQQINEQLSELDARLLRLLEDRAALLQQAESSVQEAALRRIKQVQAAVAAQAAAPKKPLLVSRKSKQTDTVIALGETEIGSGKPLLIAGPCSVESREQVREVAAALKQAGITVMRGGAFKPRTSPYEFQGLGVEGLKILKEAADEFGLRIVSEIVDPAHIELACDYVDVIQIGARNMQNFELLKAAGQANVPILLKRGLAATIEEFIYAAEYIASKGNSRIMLIERGIRTYEKATRNTLDISAVPILKQETHLPVLVDVTHSTGRKEIMAPCAKAALAAGADGVMVEVHPNPAEALSDAAQQLNIPQFHRFFEEVKQSGLL